MLRIAIDGPRAHLSSDVDNVEQTANTVANIDWSDDVLVHRHSQNLGPGKAIPWAVSWVLSEFPEAIVIEDDVTVGPQFLEFAETALALWRDDPRTFCVSGYNLVPPDELAEPNDPVRYSMVPHSYAWATWRRAWQFYDPDMTWFTQQSVRQLTSCLGSTLAGLRWRQFASHVRHKRVNTWDYQWAMSIWSQNGRVVMPNRNLIEYHGLTDGTHTFRNRSWKELPVGDIELGKLKNLLIQDEPDRGADLYLQRYGQRATVVGVTSGYLEGPAMKALNSWRTLQYRRWSH